VTVFLSGAGDVALGITTAGEEWAALLTLRRAVSSSNAKLLILSFCLVNRADTTLAEAIACWPNSTKVVAPSFAEGRCQ